MAAGKVLMHPGDLWFVKAPNRWGNLGFELDLFLILCQILMKVNIYHQFYGTSVAYLAAGHSAERRELAFKVWSVLKFGKLKELLQKKDLEIH